MTSRTGAAPPTKMAVTVAPTLPIPRVEWAPGSPREVRAAAEPILAAWVGVVPPWVRTLRVRYNADTIDEDGDTPILRIMPLPEYREAKLEIGGRWIDRNDAEREGDLLHELVHLLIAPMQTFACDLIDRAIDKESIAHGWTHDLWRKAFEGVTCDLTAALLAAREPAGSPGSAPPAGGEL